MNTLSVAVFLVAVAMASAGHLGLGVIGLNPAAHIASGSVSVGVNGAVLAGPSGSVRTDNGLGGHGAGAQLSGPAGDVRTRGGAVALDGPGLGGHGGIGLIGAPALGLGLGGIGLGGVGLGGIGLGGIGLGHGGIIAGPGLGLGLGHGLGLGLGHGW